jgi:alpha-beta hydrolase superfamily lysophospholipase
VAHVPFGPPQVMRQQIAGEWFFLKIPPNWHRRELVFIFHGAGEWVNATTSSWEAQPGAATLMQTLLGAGFAVAQSNDGFREGNGMWGNTDTQTAAVAFADWIESHYRPSKLHALAVSAGNLVLMNLLIAGHMRFASAVMLAPCLSIASEYRCPAGVDRVKTIAEAFRFTPASGCPGDPQNDAAFLSATENADPIPRLQKCSNAELRSIFDKTRLLAIYESKDPRVPPAENIVPFSHRLRNAGVQLDVIKMEADTHGSQELFLRYTPRIVAFL